MQKKCIFFVFLGNEILGQHAEMGMGGVEVEIKMVDVQRWE